MEKEKNTLNLIKRIADKGGLMGSCAKLHLNNRNKAKKFIEECKAQCHTKLAKELWGEELVREILETK